MRERLVVLGASQRQGSRLVRALQRQGLRVAEVSSAGELEFARGSAPDVVVLKARISVRDLIDTAHRLRTRGFAGGVLGISASSHEVAYVAALDAGADDVVPAAVSGDELDARVRAVLRRCDPRAEQRPEPGVEPGVEPRASGLEVDPSTRRVTHAGTAVVVGTKEAAILSLFAANPHHVLSADYLLASVWQGDDPDRARLTRMIQRVRLTLRSLDASSRITTVRGHGYRFDPHLG